MNFCWWASASRFFYFLTRVGLDTTLGASFRTNDQAREWLDAPYVYSYGPEVIYDLPPKKVSQSIECIKMNAWKISENFVGKTIIDGWKASFCTKWVLNCFCTLFTCDNCTRTKKNLELRERGPGVWYMSTMGNNLDRQGNMMAFIACGEYRYLTKMNARQRAKPQ